MARASVPSKNPIRQTRLANGKTLRLFARECGVELQALYLNECGVYNKILPSIKEKMVKKYACDTKELDRAYREFIQTKRQEFANGHNCELAGPNHLRNPIIALREHYGFKRLGWAKIICIHPSILYKIERNKFWELPSSFTEALEESGFAVVDIEELKYRYIEHARMTVRAS